MPPFAILPDHYVQDWIETRRAAAAPWGDRPSLTLALVERIAARIRTIAARLESWAHGSEDAAPTADAPTLALHR